MSVDVEIGVKTLKGLSMDRLTPVVSIEADRLSFSISRPSSLCWQTFALNQQRLRWVECGRRVAARMEASGYSCKQSSPSLADSLSKPRR